MRLSRDLALRIHFFFDECLPPALRDSKWFMSLPFRLAFGDKADVFFRFKQEAPFLTPAQLRRLYAEVAPVLVQRETDLNAACIDALERHVAGRSVLDVACGRGFLTRRLAGRYEVVGADFVVARPCAAAAAAPFVESDIARLPFADAQFDTVICAHTLEHVMQPAAAIAELRRVCARRLLVVVPKQRPYRYTFDLHLHFFPYAHDVLNFMGAPAGARCEPAGGDWLYCEDR